VAGGGDAARAAVAEIDARQIGADRSRRLVGERTQHVLQLERGVQRARGAHERVILGGAGGAAPLGLEPREPGGRDVGERARLRDLAGGELAPLVLDQDRHAPDLAVVDDRHEQRRGDVEALDQLGAQQPGARGVGHVQGVAGRDDVRDP
jgi:hypothetical protein